jgi:hypothetical protein
LKSAGAAFRSLLAQLLQDLGYTSSRADPDVWMRVAARDDGHEYYEMIFMYVDDILVLSHQATDAIKEITEISKLRKEVSNHRKFTWVPTFQQCSYQMVMRCG